MSKLGRWLPLGAVVALLGAAMVATVYANPSLTAVPQSISTEAPAQRQTTAAATPPTADPTPTVRPPQSDFQVPMWVTWLLTGLCAAAVLAVVAALVWMMLRDRLVDRKLVVKPVNAAAARQELQARVRAAVDDGLADLADDDLDPRRAVIACWVRLEEAAAVAGTPREPGDTSTDLVIRLLGAHAVSPEVLAGFAEVYRQARFATHAVDISMRDQARSALRQLRDELAAGLATVGSGGPGPGVPGSDEVAP